MINMDNWLTQEEACAFLGVRRQTLYAYVSRNKIAVEPDSEAPNRSRYSRADLTELRDKGRQSRARKSIAASTIAWGEPIIDTKISAIHHGDLYYRGMNAVTHSHKATFEETAKLLWEAARLPQFPAILPPLDVPSARARAFASLGVAAAEGLSSSALSVAALTESAQNVVGRLASAITTPANTHDCIHTRIANGWDCPEEADLIRRTLVLLADQELTTSAFAARVTASTGASLGSCAVAGLAALSGPVHGNAALLVASLLHDTRALGATVAARRWLDAGHGLPGFGHQLYPDGDPRAVDLLARIALPPEAEEIIAYARKNLGAKPTIDVFLAILVAHCRQPPKAAFALFAIGRSIGWMAHAMEQIGAGSLIRPRARYVGTRLQRAVPPDH